jgi:hypothetical protein
LTIFGVAYDSGLLGPTDGHDHSAVVAVAAWTGTTAVNFYVPNTITGDDIAVTPPIAGKAVESRRGRSTD